MIVVTNCRLGYRHWHLVLKAGLRAQDFLFGVHHALPRRLFRLSVAFILDDGGTVVVESPEISSLLALALRSANAGPHSVVHALRLAR